MTKPIDRKVTLPQRFEPQFWSGCDGRLAIVREIRRRYAALKQDAGIDSVQKDLLCQRCVFLTVQLETMELVAAQDGKFNAGVYTQMVNALVGLLKCLGLERRAKSIESLQSYVTSKKARRKRA
jgi:hypothetical protein